MKMKSTGRPVVYKICLSKRLSLEVGKYRNINIDISIHININITINTNSSSASAVRSVPEDAVDGSQQLVN